jgi:hypothetical protein
MKNLSEYLTGWLNTPRSPRLIDARWFTDTPSFQYCLIRNNGRTFGRILPATDLETLQGKKPLEEA